MTVIDTAHMDQTGFAPFSFYHGATFDGVPVAIFGRRTRLIVLDDGIEPVWRLGMSRLRLQPLQNEVAAFHRRGFWGRTHFVSN